MMNKYKTFSWDSRNFLINFFKKEEISGFLLLIFAILAVIIVNSPLESFYYQLKTLPLPINIGEINLNKTTEHWVNDGLMAIFFFLIGLELKREIMEGELSSFSKMLVPGIAAVGGMVLPAAVYIYLNYNNPENLSGWAIPTATDIAFSLAVLLVIGKKVPISLKIFLLSLAIIDDLGAILIIAFFYSSNIEMAYLLYAFFTFITLIIVNLSGNHNKLIYFILGILLWYFFLKSGIHATIAGVLLAATIPNVMNSNWKSMLKELEHSLHNFVGLFILPVFAFFNSDISFESFSLDSIFNPISLGIILGLIIGKPIGITLFTYISIKLKIFKLPENVNMIDILGLSFLCGIGFTMSLFINGLAFSSNELIESSKLGIFIGSIISAIAGYKILHVKYSK